MHTLSPILSPLLLSPLSFCLLSITVPNKFLLDAQDYLLMFLHNESLSSCCFKDCLLYTDVQIPVGIFILYHLKFRKFSDCVDKYFPYSFRYFQLLSLTITGEFENSLQCCLYIYSFPSTFRKSEIICTVNHQYQVLKYHNKEPHQIL